MMKSEAEAKAVMEAVLNRINRPNNDHDDVSLSSTERIKDDGSGSGTILSIELIGLTMMMMMMMMKVVTYCRSN